MYCVSSARAKVPVPFTVTFGKFPRKIQFRLSGDTSTCPAHATKNGWP